MTVDVRDVAQGHINALTAEPGKLRNERIIMGQETIPMVDLMRQISAHYAGKRRIWAPTRVVGYKTLLPIAMFDSQIWIMLKVIGVRFTVDNTKSREMLGLAYDRDLMESIIEMVDSMFEHGIIHDLPQRRKCAIF